MRSVWTDIDSRVRNDIYITAESKISNNCSQILRQYVQGSAEYCNSCLGFMNFRPVMQNIKQQMFELGENI